MSYNRSKEEFWIDWMTWQQTRIVWTDLMVYDAEWTRVWIILKWKVERMKKEDQRHKQIMNGANRTTTIYGNGFWKRSRSKLITVSCTWGSVGGICVPHIRPYKRKLSFSEFSLRSWNDDRKLNKVPAGQLLVLFVLKVLQILNFQSDFISASRAKVFGRLCWFSGALGLFDGDGKGGGGSGLAGIRTIRARETFDISDEIALVSSGWV